MPITPEDREKLVFSISNNNFEYVPEIVGVNAYSRARSDFIQTICALKNYSNTDKILAIRNFNSEQRELLIDSYLDTARQVEMASASSEKRQKTHQRDQIKRALKVGKLFHDWSSSILPTSTLMNNTPSVISRDYPSQAPLAMTYAVAKELRPVDENECISQGRGISLHPRLQAEKLDPKHRAWGTLYPPTQRALSKVNDAWVNHEPRAEDLTVAIEFDDELRALDQGFDPQFDRNKLDGDEAEVFNTFNHYLTETELLNYLLTTNDGLLYRGIDITPITTEQAHIFTMDMQGNLYVNRDGAYLNGRRIGHSSFTSGEPVAGAGELTIENGKITAINNASGHYTPGPLSLLRVITALEVRGVLAPDCTIRISDNASFNVTSFKERYKMPNDVQNPPDLSEKVNPARLLKSLRDVNCYLKKRASETSSFLSYFKHFNGRDFNERSRHFATLMENMQTQNKEDIISRINDSLPAFQRGRRTEYANLLIEIRDALTEDALLSNSLVQDTVKDYSNAYSLLNAHVAAQHYYHRKGFFDDKKDARGEVVHSKLVYKFFRETVSDERRTDLSKASAVTEIARLNAQNW